MKARLVLAVAAWLITALVAPGPVSGQSLGAPPLLNAGKLDLAVALLEQSLEKHKASSAGTIRAPWPP